MRIGIDATALPLNPVGAGVYTINLIRALASIQDEHEYVVFAHRSGCEQIGVPQRDGFRWLLMPDKHPALRLLWEQAIFPGIVRRERIDLLHSLHYTRPLSLPCTSVVTFHDMTFFLYPHLHTRSKRLYFPGAIRMSARKASALIAVSENTRRDAIGLLNIPPTKIVAVPLAVESAFRPVSDIDRLAEVRRRYELPEGFILYVGLVEPRKNLPLLIRAYRSLVERGVTQQLVVVGRFGWMYEDLLKQVEQFGLQEKVRFCGYINRADLPFVYNSASVFVYPTLYEGFGLPVLEAMACGIPAISSNIASIPEIMGNAGIMVPPDDENSLSEAIFEVLNDRQRHRELAEKGLRRASLFSWERTALETVKVYRSVKYSL